MWKKSFLFLIVLSYSVIVFLTYGFVGNLYFWRDDYVLLYRLQQGGLFHFPYQGWSLSYYPIYLFFKENPTVYFGASIILYILLCLVVYFFVFRVTKDYLIAYLSGLILASGYVGAEIMFMSSVSVSSLIYMIGVILLLLLYQTYLQKKSFFLFFSIIIFYGALTLLFTQRAHSLFPLLFFSDLYFSSKFSLNLKIFRNSFLRLSPYFLITFLIYILHILDFFGIERSNLGTSQIKDYLPYLNFSSLGTLVINLSNFLIPSDLSSSTDPAILATAFILVIISFFLFIKISPSLKKVIVFFVLLWIAGYINYYLVNPSTIHPSTQRYLLFGLPFFAVILAIYLKILFFSNKRILLKVMGFILAVALIYIHLMAGSQIKGELIKRSVATKIFFADLKKEVPSLEGKTLFLFDTVADPVVQNLFWDILRTGVYSTESSLASFYKVKIDNIKIVDTYEELIKDKKSNDFTKAYHFFYNSKHQLINIDKLNSQIRPQGEKIDLKSAKLFENYIDGPGIEINNNQVVYRSMIVSNDKGSRSINGLVKFDTYFPSYQPVNLQIVMKASSLVNQIKKYPYVDSSITKRPQKIDFSIIHDPNYREALVTYLGERSYFRQVAQVFSSDNEAKNVAKYIVDGNPNTRWEANKVEWVKGKKPFIVVNFGEDYTFSEVRLFSYEPRIPSIYEYQIKKDETDEWRTIYKAKRDSVINGQIKDVFPPVNARFFKIVILETPKDDFPGIQELEILKNSSQIDSDLADFIIEHPFAEIKNEHEAAELQNGVQNYLNLSIYPLSDKYLSRQEDIKIQTPIMMDGNFHTYNFKLPVGGTILKGLVVRFPNIPMEVIMDKIILNQSIDKD